jgi:putative hemolysin
MTILREILIIVGLFVANGVFAMSEMALVSARKSRLEQMAKEKQRGAAQTLVVLEDPNTFLSTIQIGITLIGIAAGAIGGATLAGELSAGVAEIGFLAPYANAIGLGIVILGSTYISLIIGELVPKRLALASPEKISTWVVGPMRVLSFLTAPAVKLLSLSTEAILAILPVRSVRDQTITEEELVSLLRESANMGELEQMESQLVERALYLDDIMLDEVMTPFPEIQWLDARMDLAALTAAMKETNHARYPVIDGNPDRILGFVRAKHLLQHALDALHNGEEFDLLSCLEPPQYLPMSNTPVDALAFFRTHPVHMALLIDEYGNVRGLVTALDILQALVGDIAPNSPYYEPDVVTREDGSLLIAGTLPMGELLETLGIDMETSDRRYRTLGGLVMAELARIPAIGDRFTWQGHDFEIVDMDGRRVDRVLVEPEAAERVEPSPADEEAVA